MIFPWGGKLNYKRISKGWAIKRIFICGKPTPIMRLCRAMVWQLPDGYFIAKPMEGVSQEQQLAEVIDSITRALQKQNPDIQIDKIKIEKR